MSTIFQCNSKMEQGNKFENLEILMSTYLINFSIQKQKESQVQIGKPIMN